jgi:AAA+ ATPase superfamily predicted ATPase
MDYFPLTLALNKAFCNRKQELEKLRDNIKNSRPTIIAAPRKHGKTSLAINAINKTKLPFAQFDFLSAIEEEDIKQIILSGAASLMNKLETGPKKLLKLAAEFFSDFNVSLAVKGISLSIEPKQHLEKPAYGILNILEKIDALAKRYNKKIILFFDEFQRVGQLSNSQAIESVIRQIAQQTTNLVFIFSGSSRHLLFMMFNDRNRPLYKLCDKILLERIAPAEYLNYFQNAAKHRWQQAIEDEVAARIFLKTDLHPYYINVVCSRLWKNNKPPKITDVDHTWEQYVIEERSQVASETDLLSMQQRKLLITLARWDGLKTPRGREFQAKANMSGATIGQSLSFLEKNDYLYRDSGGYIRVLDPLIRSVLMA